MKDMRFHSARGNPEYGSSLLIVLAFIVLITFLVVAFFSRSQSDLSASNNYSASVQAEELAQTAGDFLIAQLQQEIREGVKVSGAKATIWPARSVVPDGESDGDETDPREFLAFRTSNALPQAGYAAMLDRAYGPGVSGSLAPNPGSSIRTDHAGKGAAFESARWNAPRLLPFTPDGTSWINCPTWIYMSRSGPKAPNAAAPFNASLAQMRDLSAGNENAVIGRFAYIMYDLGGLMDVGISALADGSYLDQPKFGEKGTTAFSSLQRVLDAAGNGGDAAQFAGWRQPDEVDLYSDIVGNKDEIGLIEKGMLKVPDKSNLFFSRQDLLKFSNDNPGILRGGRPPGNSPDADSGALKFLRSRSLASNAPMISDALPYPVVSGDWRIAATNRTIPYYRVETVVREEYTILQGEPVFMRKFPLSRLRWFSDGVLASGQPSGDYTAAIKQHFGLTWSGNLGAQASTSNEWQGVPGFVYTGTNGDTPVATIKTLEQVAAENREPDFFEWIKAAINPDTIGLSAGMTNSAVALEQDQSVDFHVIQIGANIIDQADSDDIPTRIMSSAARDRNGHPLVALGVENLPFINEVVVSPLRAGEYGSADADTIEAWLQPEIWMPHFNLPNTAQEGRVDFSGNPSVSNFRFRVVDGEAWLDAWAEYQGGGGSIPLLNGIRYVSIDNREIEARIFTGDPTGDGFTFRLDDDDFSEPSLPGQSKNPNRFLSGPMGAGTTYLRRLFAGPRPSDSGFKGVFGGRVRKAGIVPGPNGSTDYQDRRYRFDAAFDPRYAIASDMRVFADPNRGTDTDGDGIKNEGTSLETFPLGERYYNALQYCTSPWPGTLPLRNHPTNGSVTPRPLTFVLEAEVNGNWIPTQVIETASYLPKLHAVSSRRIPTSVESLGGAQAVGGGGDANITTTGMIIPGYDTLILSRPVQFAAGEKVWFNPPVSGVQRAYQVPERLAWCRPILAGEDPDPANDIYPIGGSPTEKSAIARNDSDSRNPNRFLATNEPLSPKPGLGDGVGETNNDPLFADLFFGWRTTYKSSWIKLDPRTRRFGQSGTYAASPGSSIRPTPTELAGNSGSAYLDEYYSNWDIPVISPPGNNWFPGSTISTGGKLPNWFTKFSVSGRPRIALADLMKNSSETSNVAANYADKDGVVRPADLAFVPDNKLPTLPLIARSAGDPSYPDAALSRPFVLNRMFRSASELGFVFRDVPWRSLDFFSEADSSGATPSPRSGDVALLDVFCIEDSPVSAGKIDPNKISASALATLFHGTLEFPGVTETTTSLPSATELETFTQSLLDEISYDVTNPLESDAINRESDMAVTLMARNDVNARHGPRKIKASVEAFIRSLSGSMDTRTWNIFIDVVAESGRLRATADDLGEFQTSAQRRYWIFAAIDRITGRVLAYEMEAVNE